MSRKISNGIETTRARAVWQMDDAMRMASIDQPDNLVEKNVEIEEEKKAEGEDSPMKPEIEGNENGCVEMAPPRAPDVKSESPRNDAFPKIEDVVQTKAMLNCACIIC